MSASQYQVLNINGPWHFQISGFKERFDFSASGSGQGKEWHVLQRATSQPRFPSGIGIDLQGVVSFLGRLSILIDQNTQAFHMFMTALLQLFDRSDMLYGELARFVLRLLGIRTKLRMVNPQGPNGLPLPGTEGTNANSRYIEGPKAAPCGSWDNVWENDAGK